jgi:hypothetical protein
MVAGVGARIGSRGAATYVVATLAFACSSPSSLAAPLSDDPRRLVLFLSMDAGPVTTFGSAGFKLGLGSPLDASGFRVMAKAGTGHEPQGSSLSASGIRNTPGAVSPEAMAVVGHEWKLGTTYVGLYAGGEVDARLSTRALSVDRPARLGPRVQIDLWSNPTPDTLIHASGNLGGASLHIWSRLAIGWRLHDLAFFGPEAEIYRERDYRKDRIGLHMTGLKLFGTELRLSGGWQRSGRQEQGPYATLGLLWKR